MNTVLTKKTSPLELSICLISEMGCSSSKLDNEAVVQLCKDRNKFIKQAVEYRMKFVTAHIAYIRSMKRVSTAIQEYITWQEQDENTLDSFKQDFTPIKKTNPSLIFISEKNSCCKINYLKSTPNPSISVEMRPPQSPETVRIEAYGNVHHFEMDNVLEMHSSSMSLQNDGPNCSPISAQTSQWDFFWNPFNSLDYYGYTNGNLDETSLNNGVREVTKSESDETLEKKEVEAKINEKEEENIKTEDKPNGEVDVAVGDVEDSDDSKKANEIQSLEVEKGKVNEKKTAVTDCGLKEETPGFTVYVDQRLSSMEEVVKDLDERFMIASNSATEVSSILMSSGAHNSSKSSDLKVLEMLNPGALFRSASSRSLTSSSRFFMALRDEDYENSSMFTANHQSTLEKLYAWEKKLYREVKAGERIRKAYEKKCAQLRNQDGKGEEPPISDKTREALTNMHTQINVSIHLVEAASKRIETLRNEELEPQMLELVQGLARMWKVMAECHQLQKSTLDDAKILQGRETKKKTILPSELQRLAHSAANLETELKNWKTCFETWIVSQRSYVHALTGWLLRCVRLDPDMSKLPFSACESFEGSSMFNVLIQWSKFLDAIQEAPVLDALDLAAARVHSMYAQLSKEDSCQKLTSDGQLEGQVATAEKMADVANRVFCVGMSMAVNSLMEFAVCSAEGYAYLVKQWDNEKQPKTWF